MATINRYNIKELRPLKDHILVKNMIFGERQTRGGIILPSDDCKSEGIRPRWGEVFAVGPEQHDVKPGQYVLVKHGRWTRGISVILDGEETDIRRVDNNDILLVSDEPQFDDTMSDAI